MKPRGPSFLRRLREIERALEWANASLTMSAEVHHAFTLSAEWLLDNAYLIREQVTDLRESLPQKYYGELPLIASGPEAGLPRVYHVASEMVAESGGALEPEIIRKFLVAFQATAPLDIGELWALPLMLRLQLLERLRAVAIQVEQQQSQSEEADFWANRLITAVRHGSPRLLRGMEELVERYPEPTPHFASELVAHLYDEEAALPMVSSWLERSLRAPLLEVIQQEHRRQAVQQTALANVINSCRRLAQVQWQELFQSISWAENELAADPAGVYDRLDFETRDRCRGAVEEIARWSKCSEQETIDEALALAKAAEDEVARHVGYYLIDAGRPALERATSARVPLAESSRRWLRAHAAGAYFGSIFLLTLAMVAAPLFFVAGAVHWLSHGLFAFLLLLPASELAVLAVNYFVTSLLPPQVLPKMSFKKEGIPDDCRTLVVVPTLLTTPDAIQNELNRLEIRYLGNTDANLRFSLLTDFADAPRESMPEDAEYIDIVARGIEELNRRHGAGRFFLFHRGRTWSESEQRWIGWERKRGKLEQLNRFLIGESAPELEGFLCAGDRAQLEGIRFVITLDADTQLLRDTARRIDRNPGASAESGASFTGWPPGDSRLHDHSTGRQCLAAEREGDMVLTHLCRSAWDRSLHTRRLRCLPGFGRRRQLSRQRHLRTADVSSPLVRTISNGALVESRSIGRQLRPRRARDGHRAAGCLSEQLHRVVESAAPLDSRRLANHRLAEAARAGGRRQG